MVGKREPIERQPIMIRVIRTIIKGTRREKEKEGRLGLTTAFLTTGVSLRLDSMSNRFAIGEGATKEENK